MKAKKFEYWLSSIHKAIRVLRTLNQKEALELTNTYAELETYLLLSVGAGVTVNYKALFREEMEQLTEFSGLVRRMRSAQEADSKKGDRSWFRTARKLEEQVDEFLKKMEQGCEQIL